MPTKKKTKKTGTSTKKTTTSTARKKLVKSATKKTTKKTAAASGQRSKSLAKTGKTSQTKRKTTAKQSTSAARSSKKVAKVKTTAKKTAGAKAKTGKKLSAKKTTAKSTSKKRIRSGLLLFQDDSLEVVDNVKIPTVFDNDSESSDDYIEINLAEDRIDKSSEVENIAYQQNGSGMIRINHASADQSSPFVVNLKDDNDSKTAKKASEVDSYLKFEEKLAKFEQKLIGSFKQNFITPDLQAEGDGSTSKGASVLFYKIWENLSSFLSKQGEKFVNQVLSYLASNKTDNSQAEDVVKEEIESVNQKSLPDSSVSSDSQEEGSSYVVPIRQVQLSWWQRHSVVTSVSLFVIAAMLLTVPIKAFTFYQQLQMQKKQVLGASASVFAEVEEALSDLGQFNFSEAEDNFNSAASGLVSLVRLLDNYPPLLVSVAEVVSEQGKYLKSGKALLESARYLAQAGADLSGALANIKNSPDLSLLNKLYLLQQGVVMSKNRFELAYANLQKVDFDNLPDNVRDDLSNLNRFLPTVIKATDQLEEMLALARQLGGEKEPQRYLIVFQNVNELRPTGGFMGTVAELDVKDGEVVDLNIPPGGVYDFQGSLKVLLAAPKPLRMMNANWQLQDANWFFDFPTSAKKVLWFYEKSGGPTRDGLIAINSNLLPKLLEVVGDIELPERQVVLTPDNALFWLQQEVEYGKDKQDNQPKKVISELTPILLERLENLPPDKFIPVLSIFWQALQKKDIQIYHRQTEIEDKLKELGWAGEVKSTEGDYLAIVNTNIAGGKTDEFIKQRFYLQTDIDAAGNIINNLRIVKTHTGDPNDLFGGDANIDYLRVYVPQGAELISTQGFYQPSDDKFNDPAPGYSEDDFLAAVEQNPIVHEQSGTRITEEFGKTVFGNWVKVEPGETVEVSLTYRLPFRIEFAQTDSNNPLVTYFNRAVRFLGVDIASPAPLALYTILWQKQSGQKPAQIEHTLSLPADWQFTTVDKLQNRLGQTEQGVAFTTTLEKDFFWGGIILRP